MTVRSLGLLPGPVLLFGGPYSNLSATEAMRCWAESNGIAAENCICTGDVVAYGARPEETVSLVRDWGISVLMGNCEESVGNGAADCGCGFQEGSTCSALAEEWYDHAVRHTSGESRAWMRGLPAQLEFSMLGRRFRVVHGGVRRINRFIFASAPQADKRAELDWAGTDAVVGGHSGIPFGELVEGRAWLNVGAIGMPANDGTRDGWHLVLEAEGDRIRAAWHRLAYDAEAEHRMMLEAGLGGGYAEALLSGLWPSTDVLPAFERARRGEAIELAPLYLEGALA